MSWIKRTFIQASRAWYGHSELRHQTYVDEFLVELSDADGRLSFMIEIHELGDGPAARLCLFDDAWRALAEMPDPMVALAELNGTSPTALDIRGQLLALGFEDETPTLSPLLAKTDARIDADGIAVAVASMHRVDRERVEIVCDDGVVSARIKVQS